MIDLQARLNGNRIEFVDTRSGQVLGAVSSSGVTFDGQSPQYVALSATTATINQIVATPGAVPAAFVGASTTLVSVADNADLTVTSLVSETVAVTVALVNPGGTVATTTAAAVGSAITVTLACTSDTIVATAADVKTAIEANPVTDALVAVVADGTGLGVVDAFAATALTGGTDNVAASAGTILSGTNGVLYYAIDDVAVTDAATNWKTVDLSAL